MSRIISPSILSSDFGRLYDEIEMLNASRAEWIHLDVMDGVFVPNITYGMPVIKTLRPKSDKVFDAHLMIVDPGRYVDAFRDAGVDVLSVHVEACTHLHRVIQQIQAAGMKAGVALNPHTPVSAVEEVADMADLFLIMGVNPGFGGQKFIPNTLSKISRMKELLLRKNSAALIEMDGGATLDNARKLFDAGVDVLVAGNAVFGSADPKKTIELLLQAPAGCL